jgi:WD40 repeat protein
MKVNACALLLAFPFPVRQRVFVAAFVPVVNVCDKKYSISGRSSPYFNVTAKNALSYSPIDLLQYAPSVSRLDHLFNDNSASTGTSEIVPSSVSSPRKFGVTSLHVIPYPQMKAALADAVHVMVGTKDGDLISLPIECKLGTWTVSQNFPIEWLNHKQNGTAHSPSPIYSLAAISVTTRTILLMGSADRHVHVWDYDFARWNTKQRLGPHTGWVKSVVALPTIHLPVPHCTDSETRTVEYCERYRFLSIGCNRIEYWRQNDSEWIHCSTTSIESYPSLRMHSSASPSNVLPSTLSSDILCLEVCDICITPSDRSTIIAAGGVDGRIHFYLDCHVTTRLQHLTTVTAHQGRVNVLSFDVTQQVLMSGSHDGSVMLWSLTLSNNSRQIVSDNETIPLALVVTHIATHQLHDGARVTALVGVAPQVSKSSDWNIIVGTYAQRIHPFTHHCKRFFREWHRCSR